MYFGIWRSGNASAILNQSGSVQISDVRPPHPRPFCKTSAQVLIPDHVKNPTKVFIQSSILICVTYASNTGQELGIYPGWDTSQSTGTRHTQAQVKKL